jgi:dolichol-phosphate mannosyltransferase
MGLKQLGIVIPAYKESESIASLIREILQQAPEAKIVVVDDTPDLSTVQAIESLRLPTIKVIHRTTKGGRGSAVLEGLKYLYEAGCLNFVEMDADFSHPPSQIPSLVAEAEARKLDLLIASRYLSGSTILNWPLSRRIFSKLSNILARIVLRVPIVDYTNGYRVYSRRAAETVLATCGVLGKGFIALSEILVNLHFRNFKIGETPTVFTNRVRGESSLNFTEIWGAFSSLFKIYAHSRRIKQHSST